MTFPSKNVPELRARLEMLLSQPALVRTYEQKARQHVMKHYSWDTVTDSTEQLYRELVANRRA
jgi:glycosyltransferase involved in cell wall biosynthesis